jgi:hypothetical protein
MAAKPSDYQDYSGRDNEKGKDLRKVYQEGKLPESSLIPIHAKSPSPILKSLNRLNRSNRFSRSENSSPSRSRMS